MRTTYEPGEPVIYRATKFSTRPGPRAHHVAPSPQGELYNYLVDKFWVVGDVLADGRLLLKTRRGKQHIIAADDPNLRPARWWERWLYRSRFPDRSNEMAKADTPSPLPKHRTA